MPETSGNHRQQAHVVGNQAIIIQVGRDARDIIVDAHASELWLNPRDQSHEAPTGEARRLIPYYRFLDCIGRDDWLQRLEDWLQDPLPLSVRAIIGSGGRGKTRLAVELCRKAGDAWHAGFVSDDALKRLYDHQDPAMWRWPGPTLIVVDYAARQADLLRRWLLALKASHGNNAPRLRILLLERHGNTGGGWWNTLFHQGGYDDELLADVLALPEPEELPPLAPTHRHQLFTHAVRKYGGSGTTLEANPLFRQRLQATDWAGDPLYLAMAVQVAVAEGVESVLSLNRTGLAFRFAKREQGRALKLIDHENKDVAHLLPHLMAMATLCQGLDRTQLMTVIKNEKEALECDDAGSPRSLADLLSEVLPSDTIDRVDPIRPDMIGEAFILQELKQSSESVQRAFRVAGTSVATTVIRCAQDFVRAGYKQPLAWLDGLVAQPDVSMEDLLDIANALPPSSVALMEHATQIYAEMESRLRRDISTQGTPQKIPLLAHILNNLAVYASTLGRREEALLKAQEAVAIRRELAADRPDAFRPDLAMSLNNLANRLSELGRREEALLMAQEAVAIRRELAAARPDAFRPDLALSLNNLAKFLSELGRREEALLMAQEAVAIRKELAAARPDAFRPDLARSLNNLAKFLSELGRREEALLMAQEAVAIRRELAAARPDAFRPDLALSLNNLANSLSELGRREEALLMAQEAVAIHRELAAARPDAFRPDLASSLNNLANILSELGRREEALLMAQEAVAIHRELAAARPDAFRPDLALSLNNLAKFLSELGRREEALLMAQEAVASLGPYFHKNPLGFRTWMAVMIRQYLSLCQLNQCEPNLELIKPLLDDFEKISDQK